MFSSIFNRQIRVFDFEAAINNINVLIERERYEEALIELQAAELEFYKPIIKKKSFDERVNIWEQRARLFITRAKIFAKQLNTEEASKYYYMAAADMYMVTSCLPNVQQHRLTSSWIFMQIGLFKKAANEYREAFKLDPAILDPSHYISMANCLYAREQYEECITYCNKALELNNTSIEASDLLNRANQAQASMTVTANPASATAEELFLQGSQELESLEYDQAHRTFRLILDLKNVSAYIKTKTYINIGNIYIIKHKYAESLLCYQLASDDLRSMEVKHGEFNKLKRIININIAANINKIANMSVEIILLVHSLMYAYEKINYVAEEEYVSFLSQLKNGFIGMVDKLEESIPVVKFMILYIADICMRLGEGEEGVNWYKKHLEIMPEDRYAKDMLDSAMWYRDYAFNINIADDSVFKNLSINFDKGLSNIFKLQVNYLNFYMANLSHMLSVYERIYMLMFAASSVHADKLILGGVNVSDIKRLFYDNRLISNAKFKELVRRNNPWYYKNYVLSWHVLYVISRMILQSKGRASIHEKINASIMLFSGLNGYFENIGYRLQYQMNRPIPKDDPYSVLSYQGRSLFISIADFWRREQDYNLINASQLDRWMRYAAFPHVRGINNASDDVIHDLCLQFSHNQSMTKIVNLVSSLIMGDNQIKPEDVAIFISNVEDVNLRRLTAKKVTISNLEILYKQSYIRDIEQKLRGRIIVSVGMFEQARIYGEHSLLMRYKGLSYAIEADKKEDELSVEEVIGLSAGIVEKRLLAIGYLTQYITSNPDEVNKYGYLDRAIEYLKFGSLVRMTASNQEINLTQGIVQDGVSDLYYKDGIGYVKIEDRYISPEFLNLAIEDLKMCLRSNDIKLVETVNQLLEILNRLRVSCSEYNVENMLSRLLLTQSLSEPLHDRFEYQGINIYSDIDLQRFLTVEHKKLGNRRGCVIS